MDYHYDPSAERAAAWETMQANVKRRKNEARERPFRFEDLNGKPEPKSWGPVYPHLAGVEKWRKLERKREFTNEETRAYGRAVGEAIRRLNRPKGYGPITLKCTVQNTCGTDNTAAGEDKRYRHWVEVRLPALRAERLAHKAAKETAREAFWSKLREAA